MKDFDPFLVVECFYLLSYTVKVTNNASDFLWIFEFRFVYSIGPSINQNDIFALRFKNLKQMKVNLIIQYHYALAGSLHIFRMKKFSHLYCNFSGAQPTYKVVILRIVLFAEFCVHLITQKVALRWVKSRERQRAWVRLAFLKWRGWNGALRARR